MPRDVAPGDPLAIEASPRGLVTMSRPGRVEEAPPRYPPHTMLMLVLSGIFVALALAFSARVLDALPAQLADAQLDTIETWTWLLAGCALTLMLWGTVVFPLLERTGLSWRVRWLALVLAGIVGSSGGMLAQQSLYNALTSDTDGSRARRAVQVHVLNQALLAAPEAASSIGFSPDLMGTASGKAFMAMLMVAELRREDSEIARPEALSRLLESLAAQRVGTAAQVYDNIFVPSVRSLRDAFNSYVAAQKALAEEVRSIPDKQNAIWNDYQDNLAKRGLVPARMQRAEWPAAAQELRALGPAMPPDWNPADRAAFATAYSTQLREAADSQYAESVARLVGAPLQPGLEWEQFVAHPEVQARWRKVVDAADGVTLSATMGFQSFQDLIYRPMVDRIVRPKLDRLEAPAAHYTADGAMGQDGKAALRWVVVPALALALMLAAVAWHVGSLAFYLGTVAAPRWRGRRRLILAGLGIAAIALVGARGPVTRSECFTRLEDWIADEAGPAWLAARGAVEAESLVYLWGNRVRRIAFGSHEFGMAPRPRPQGDDQTRLEKLIP
jgi:hypothetical protein